MHDTELFSRLNPGGQVEIMINSRTNLSPNVEHEPSANNSSCDTICCENTVYLSVVHALFVCWMY